ncbi:MAG: FMN-binding protein [Coriobacteriales bacterium]|jgi:uncharacterized protein with FMN-binding domain|nr:FMN-binding protein [Coriobacteriales bacterium]
MTLGIITAVLIALCCTNVFLRKHRSRTARIAHMTLGIAALIVGITHFVLVLPLFEARPLAVWVSGALLLLILTGLCLCGLYKRGRLLRLHRALAVATLVALFSHVTVNVVALNTYQQAARSIQIADVDLSRIGDGSYTGECDVGYVYAEVSVTVRSGAITDVTILKHRTEGGHPAERLVGDVVDEQRITVDAVSGATNSSNVIRRAIYNALTNE